MILEKLADCSVIQRSNGIIAVFDAEGRHLPEYSGPRAEVIGKVLTDANTSTKFFYGHWGFCVEWPREKFLSMERGWDCPLGG